LAAACSKAEPKPVVAAVAPQVSYDAATPAGAIRGTIVFDGTPPVRNPIPMGGAAGCSEHSGTVLSETVIVNAGHLQNVLVVVKSGVDKSKLPPVPSEPVVLEQHGCLYRPHVLALRTGQKLIVNNTDGFNHNVNAKSQRAKNPSFNQVQPGGGKPIETVFEQPELLVPIGCDIHPWMRAYVHAIEHPYFALSGADGAFAIEGLPPGKYTIEAVHETLGRQELELVLDGKAGAQATFHFRESN
jgi:plastocyanin